MRFNSALYITRVVQKNMSIYHTVKNGLIFSMFSLLSMLCYGQRPVQVLYFQSDADAPTEAYVYDNERMVAKTDLPRSNFSKTFKIPRGKRRLHFLDKQLAEGEQAPEEMPFVDIPKKWKRVLLMVFEDETNSVMPIQVKAIDASDNVFGPGSICAINFSEIGVIGTIGDKELKLKPKSFKIIEDPIAENGYYPAKLYGVIKEGAKPRRFIKQMWQHDKDTREVLFILPKPAPRYATYYCAPIRDF